MSKETRSYSFLFTDVEGSTRLWERHSSKMSVSLAHHNQLLSSSIESNNGRVFKTVGDGFCAVFHSASNALQAAIDAQIALAESVPETMLSLKVRMGLHSGNAEEIDDDYFGPTLNRVARLMSAAHGQQILISSQFKHLLNEQKLTSLDMRNLGLHKLRDLNEPIHLFQVLIPDLPNNYQAIRSLSPRPSNLPAQLSSFIGRETEVEEICKRLRQDSVRLLTLLGPGGIGKTRLSLRVATNMIDEYEDGIFFVEIASRKHRNEVIEAIANALNIQDNGNTSLLDHLKEFLQQRQLLLVLDNYEQAIETAPLMNELLAVAPGLKILVTSREELFIYGEQIFSLSPLNLPEKISFRSIDDLMGFSAIRLFVERSKATHADFTLDQSNAKQVVDICSCLDGLPLAIELASVRTREFSLSEIHSQLSRQLDILNRGPRDLPDRQRTMRGAIDWSYQLLPPEEQDNFKRLAVFVGPFTVEAADEIAETYYLNRLKEKSLVKQIHLDDGSILFELMETLREYALEQLKSDDDCKNLQIRHAEYYLKLLESSEALLTDSNQATGFKNLENEQYNFQAALEYFLDRKSFENAGRMVAILWRFWGVYSRLSSGTSWIKQVLAHSTDLSSETHAKVCHGAGRLALLQTNLQEAIHHLKTSLQLHTKIDDLHGRAIVSLSLGEVTLKQGNTSEAEKYFNLARDFFQKTNEKESFARCLTQLGRLAFDKGDFSTAKMLFQKSVDLNRTVGSIESLAIAINDLAEVYRIQDNSKAAMRLYNESLFLYRKLDFDVGIAVMLHNLGQIQRKLGDLENAYCSFREAISLLHTLEEKQVIAECLAGIGSVYLDSDELEFAIQIFGAAQQLIDALGIELSPADKDSYDIALKKSKSLLSGKDWRQHWTRGQSRPLPQIIAEISLRELANISRHLSSTHFVKTIV